MHLWHCAWDHAHITLDTIYSIEYGHTPRYYSTYIHTCAYLHVLSANNATYVLAVHVEWSSYALQ